MGNVGEEEEVVGVLRLWLWHSGDGIGNARDQGSCIARSRAEGGAV